MTGAKRIEWLGRSRKDLRSFPKEARLVFGQALWSAQQGELHENASKMKQNLRDVVEVRADADFGNSTYRAMCTTKIGDIVYVLHVFKKKASKGIATPKRELETIERRLRTAAKHYKEHYERGKI